MASCDATLNLIKKVDEILHGRKLCPECMYATDNKVVLDDEGELEWNCKECGTNSKERFLVELWVFESGCLVVSE